MIDLTTTYLGLKLRNPLVVSACPLTDDLSTLQRFEDAGAAAAVFPSLFEEQIEWEEIEFFQAQRVKSEAFAEAMTFMPDLYEYNVGPEQYLQRFEKAKKSIGIPLIGSLNGVSTGGWIRYSKLLEEAGADALELNIYWVPTDPEMSPQDVEDRYADLVGEVRDSISIPLAVKVGPFFSAFAHTARRLVHAGANGLVLFNRFVHPDIDLDDLKVVPHLELSRSFDSRLPLMWIGLLRGRINASLAATSGVHTWQDMVKLLMVGADVTMVASSLYLNGPDHLRTLLRGMETFLFEHEYTSVEQMKGSMSQEHSPDPTAFERVNYMKTLTSYGGGYQEAGAGTQGAG